MRTKIEPGVNLVLRAAYRLDGKNRVWRLLGSCVGKIIMVYLGSFTIREEDGNPLDKKTEEFVVENSGVVVSHELLHLAIREEDITRPMEEEEAVVASMCSVASNTS